MIIDLILYALIILVTGILVAGILFYRYMKTSKLLSHNSAIDKHYELTILLGSGGHTGELTLMLKNLHFEQLDKLNVLITSNDKSSQQYFTNLLNQ